MVLNIYEKCNEDKGCSKRWKRWEEHRNTINSIISKKILSKNQIKDAIVLGAGRCEDIDLKFLLSNVESLTLVDYDSSSMERALERQELTEEEKKKIILKGNIEFTGFYSEDFINKVTDKIKTKEECEKIVQFIMHNLNSNKVNFSNLLGNNKYSLVISGAVHSQLIVPYTQIAAIDTEYANGLMNKAGYIANILAENYNRALLSLLKEDGHLFSYFDVMELSERNDTLQYESLINGLLAQNDYEKIDKFFLQSGGVAGARHGHQHLLELLKTYTPYQECWVWNFRENKKYYVCGICFSRT